MRLKLVTMIGAVAMLAACSSSSDQVAGTAGQGGANPDGSIQRGSLAQLQSDLSRVGDRVFFETDQWTLRPEGQQTIQGWAQLLRQNAGANIILEGHADERGTREYNIALGERRAATARDYLVSLGIDARRIRTISYGKERPAITESNPDGWAQNRRSVIVVQGLATS